MNKKYLVSLILCYFVSWAPGASAQIDSTMSVNVQGAPLKGVLEMIAAKSGLQLVLDHEPTTMITLNQSGVSAKQVLEKLSNDQQIEYTIRGNQLIITKRQLAAGGSVGDAREILLKYASAADLLGKLAGVIGTDSKVLADESSNKLIFIGPDKAFDKIKSLITLFDAPQKQIMIEALIVETSHSYMQQLGVSTAFLGNSTKTNGPASPNGIFQTTLGFLSGHNLDVKLTAAESHGDAKVISRPKVITLNNKLAKIQSGITFSVKTLSSVGNAGPSGQGAAGVLTGGIASIEAGLNLSILPSLVGEDSIRLVVDINDSQPDNGTAVDGIPGILKNAANTTVIVKNKQTAVIAGLIKKQKSKNSDGVPFLSDIPLIGLLFKSHAENDQNNELVIFLTPTMGDPENTVPIEMAAIQDAASVSETENAKIAATAARDIAEAKKSTDQK